MSKTIENTGHGETRPQTDPVQPPWPVVPIEPDPAIAHTIERHETPDLTKHSR